MYKKTEMQNEVMDKLLEKLKDTNKWTKKNFRYKLIDSDLVIDWGEEADMMGTITIHRKISAPVYMRIPFRYRSRVSRLLEKIDHRNFGAGMDRLEFLNDYLSGHYRYKKTISGDLSEMTMWMVDEGINEYAVIDGIIWFKNEADAMAFKLKWS